jgi:alanyl-tRNA synthetase
MASPTERLYYADSFALAFDASVIAHDTFNGRASVVLDRSAFYPESGGQLPDTGTLSDAVVRDVQVDDAGVVHHILDTPLPDVGTHVRGAVDRSHRRLQMSLHTGQHMLSRALLDEAGAETVSSRLGATACTIDVNLAAIDEASLARAEALVNAVIEDDRTIRSFFPTPDELAGLPLRRAPKVTENIRVVDVGGFDVSPCGGTHCTRTAQVGGVTITGVERYKGKLRVTFLAGRVAWSELGARSRSLVELSRMFTCGPHDTRAAVERLRTELQTTRDSLGNTRARWAELYARTLVEEAKHAETDRVVCSLDASDVDTLRTLAGFITSHQTIAMLATNTPDGMQVVIARPEGAAFDCGAWLKRAAAAHGGRGGGRADRAEGRFPTGIVWETVARSVA